MGGKKAPETKLPTAQQLAPLIDLQAQYNRVGYRTPFGEQRYIVGPDGRSSVMETDIGPEGRALVGRAVGIGMTDSARMRPPEQVNAIAGALANRIGSRFGLDPQQGFQLSQTPAQTPSKPAAQAAMPRPSQPIAEQGAPQYPAQPVDPASNVIGGGRMPVGPRYRQPAGRGGASMAGMVSRIREDAR